jgi:DNA polymerase III subunit epsilon
MLCSSMPDLLHELPVLFLDCQASGATPAYGDLLELGWAVGDGRALRGPIRSHWVVPRSERGVRRAVRELTGWSEACVAESVHEGELWRALGEAAAAVRGELSAAPTVIHYARFELPFLRDLHERLAADDERARFPFAVLDVHTIAERLFPDLPRRNIRALAGFLGHAPELLRRSAGHVEATAFIWRALLPKLAEVGIERWSSLQEWLALPKVTTRRARRVYPLAPQVRLSLPDRPGVYRFVRLHGDVLYVGKAASLKKRVASHFAGGARATERALEMLTQVHDIRVTETPSVLEAALLETDEIKQLDPPYNVQLRSGERSAWFAARDLQSVRSEPDDQHRLGPLPSRRALSPLSALIALVDGAPPEPRLCAIALAVPTQLGPEQALFAEGWAGFVADHLAPCEGRAARRLDCASRALWSLRGRKEVESPTDDAPPALWDLARVRRRLERNLVQTGLMLRRARWLCVLAEADVVYREQAMSHARALRVRRAVIDARDDLADVAGIAGLAPGRAVSLRARQACFDAAAYDRLRVLATELQRVQSEGGELAVRIGRHLLVGERLRGVLRMI